jgi:hypothetical protein
MQFDRPKLGPAYALDRYCSVCRDEPVQCNRAVLVRREDMQLPLWRSEDVECHENAYTYVDSYMQYETINAPVPPLPSEKGMDTFPLASFPIAACILLPLGSSHTSA